MLINRLLKFEGDPAGGTPKEGDPVPPEKAFQDAVDAAAKKAVEEAAAAKKPPEDPKYEPPPDNIKNQAAFLIRDAEKGGKALPQLLAELAEQGLVIEGDGDDTAKLTERVAKGEQENAKLQAVVKYNLSEDDLAILSGTPDEIMARAAYLRKKYDSLKPEEGKGDEGGDPGEKKGTPTLGGTPGTPTILSPADADGVTDLEQLQCYKDPTPAQKESYAALKQGMAEDGVPWQDKI